MSANGTDVAIVGMSCRVPGASTLAEFWQQVVTGASCISRLDSRPGEVGARGVLADLDRFDASLFRLPASEAAALDPQHRIFLELCWHALEDAGIDPFRTSDLVAVYASCSPPAPGPLDGAGTLSASYHRTLSTSPEFLAMRVSHRLDLKGESVLVQTACSSSLVAVHMACQSLLSGQCDAAIAGGISAAADQSHGYVYEEGMLFSPDGECRPFDERAGGTIPGSGGGAVVLQRLEDARREGHEVYAVVKGSAINNDGATKASFMAPSVAGQAEVVATALAVAGVDPSTVGLLEAHGTATPLGDEVEIEALKRAYEGRSDRATALGSLKGAFGHLDRAAGVAGVIKAALCLSHEALPPSTGSETPRKSLELERSPFRLVDAAARWERGATPRRAGVSAFGVGGTNAHAVLEEAADPESLAEPSPGQPVVLTVSARSERSMAAMTDELASWLDEEAPADLASVAATRNLRRAQLEVRCAAAGRTAKELAAGLRAAVPRTAGRPRLVFMFPGHGGAALHASSVLYRFSEPYRTAVDDCAEALRPFADLDLREVLTDAAGDERLTQMEVAQPALFAAEYGLAQLLLAWGVRPDVMIGHSMGEIVAATVAGVFDLEDALRLVTVRGRIIDEHARGSMLGVALSREEALEAISGTDLDLAAVNASRWCVASGPTAAVAELEAKLRAAGVETRRLRIASAGHSRLVEPGLPELQRALAGVTFGDASVPVVGALSGRVGEMSGSYWVRHLRETVDFAAAVREASSDDAIFVEVGIGHGLSWLVTQDGATDEARTAVPLVDPEDPERSVLDAIGRLWCSGADVDWHAIHRGGRTRHVRLPLYRFDHSASWPVAERPEPRRDGRNGAAAGVHDDRANGAEPGGRQDAGAPRAISAAEVEERLFPLWRELLGADVAAGDNFFDVGGDSVKAIRMVSLARERGIVIPLKAFLREPTIAAVARGAAAASEVAVGEGMR